MNPEFDVANGNASKSGSADLQAVEVTADEAIQQIPATITLPEAPAAADARDKLLQAIAAEAEAVTNTHRGQASAALESLARAYALLITGTALAPAGELAAIPLTTRAGGHQVGLCLELEP